MFAAYGAAEGLKTGLAKTFDGDHPCSVCMIVEHQTASEKAPDLVSAVTLDPIVWTVFFHERGMSIPRSDYAGIQRDDKKPVRLEKEPITPPPQRHALQAV